jgi:ferric-dicitrate binding protein FerR (iron transport regulator)
MEPKLAWFQERLSLDDKSLSKLVQKSASVFNRGIDETLEPKLAWLQDRLRLDNKSLSKLVQFYPSVFNCSIQKNLEPKLTWLQERTRHSFRWARHQATGQELGIAPCRNQYLGRLASADFPVLVSDS